MKESLDEWKQKYMAKTSVINKVCDRCKEMCYKL